MRGPPGGARNDPDVSDDEETSIYGSQPQSRTKRETRKGHGTDDEPTAVDPATPVATEAARSEPIRVISMKTPGEAETRKRAADAAAPAVKLRPMSDVSGVIAPPSLGTLAPPRDVQQQARGRRQTGQLVIWVSAVVVIGAVVMAVVFLLARG